MCVKLLKTRGCGTLSTIQSGLKFANKEHQRHRDETLPLYQRVSRIGLFPNGCSRDNNRDYREPVAKGIQRQEEFAVLQGQRSWFLIGSLKNSKRVSVAFR